MVFNAMPATPRCRQLFAERTHLLLGVSPFNSRFSESYVSRLVAWAATAADRVDVLLAGDETALLLEATGTPPGRARRKAREAIARNRRTAEKALREHRSATSSVHSISDFYECENYRLAKKQAEESYYSDSSFREACIDMSRQAIAGRLRGVGADEESVSEDQAELAAHYVLAELPLFLNSPEMLNVPRSLLVYHQPWDLGKRIFAEEFSIRVSEHQGYLVVTDRDE